MAEDVLRTTTALLRLLLPGLLLLLLLLLLVVIPEQPSTEQTTLRLGPLLRLRSLVLLCVPECAEPCGRLRGLSVAKQRWPRRIVVVSYQAVRI